MPAPMTTTRRVAPLACSLQSLGLRRLRKTIDRVKSDVSISLDTLKRQRRCYDKRRRESWTHLGAYRAGPGPRRRRTRRLRAPAAARRGPPLCGVSRRPSHPPAACASRSRAACGDGDPDAADAAAAAIELLHCASLVHDDLPCFDDADLRRGKPSVHVAFGEPLAVLAGDALIVLAFETLARGARPRPAALPRLTRIVGARRSARPHGIVAGQAWECEAAVVADRLSARQDRRPVRRRDAWPAPRRRGRRASLAARSARKLGEAYQVADDLRDVLCDEEELGKPIGQDAARAAAERRRATWHRRRQGACSRRWCAARPRAIPPCPGAEELRALIKASDRAVLPQAARAASRPERRHGERAPPRAGCRHAASWRETLAGTRHRGANRLIAESALPALGGRSPLTRPIARKRARALFDLCAGFVYSQILLACVRLRLFEFLADGPRSVEAVAAHIGAAARIGIAPSATPRRRCGSCSALPRRSLRPRTTRRGDAAAIPASPPWSSITRCSTPTLRDPVALLRGEKSRRSSAGSGPMRQMVARANRAAPATDREAQRLQRADVAVAASGRRGRSRRLSDSPTRLPARRRRRRGRLPRGGRGAARRDCKLMLFDLPPVADRRRQRARDAGPRRAGWRSSAASFLTDPLPAGADLVSLVRVLHDHDDDSALALLRAAHAALPPGGTLLIAEPMAGAPGRRADRRRLFRLLPVAMGQRPARAPQKRLRACCARPDFPDVRA